MGALLQGKVTVEEYFALDDSAEGRLEYHDGEIFPVADATIQHAVIHANASLCVGSRLKGSPCVAATHVRVRTTARNYVVPDIAIVCGGFIPATESNDAITNPKVIVEILSPSTADFDHGAKFALYCKLPSFSEYLLIAQDAPMVEVFYKVSDAKWILTKYEGTQSLVKIESLDIEIPASEIYVGSEFSPAS